MTYLDHNAATSVLSEVFETMRPYFCKEWDNPSSAHKFGSMLKGVIGRARAQGAELIRAKPHQIILAIRSHFSSALKPACSNSSVPLRSTTSENVKESR
jgi:cysteine sulfinate desulfinase/cysteine desulfurase-like protein